MKKYLSILFALVLAVSLMLVPAAPAAATISGNLLTNPGAETGDMTGWTSSTGVAAKATQPESTGTVLPYAGNYFFSLHDSSSPAWMSQSVDLTGLGGTPILFSAGGYIQTEWYPEGTSQAITDNDYGELVVEFYDSTPSLVGSSTSGPIGHPVYGRNSSYAPFSLSGSVPSTAVSATYKLSGYLIDGSRVNVFYDDLSFTVDLAVPCTNTADYLQVKVAQVPIPWQFWAFDPATGEVIDIIRISPTWLDPPPGQPAGNGLVFIQRWFATVEEPLPLKALVWDFDGGVPSTEPPPALATWTLFDNLGPIEIMPEVDYELPILVTPDDGAVLVAYTVRTVASDSIIEAHFINEAILESKSPRAIVQVLVNFDIHNGTERDDITNFELDFFNLEFSCDDVIDALGFVVLDPTELWGANEANPLVVRHIPGGTEVKWVEPGRPLQDCEWLHVGLAFVLPDLIDGEVNGVDVTVQGYWTIIPTEVPVDIKPGSDPNSINLNGNGVVPVGVFGTADFDVNDIDVGTVRFGVLGTEAAAVHSGHIEDLNGDGIDDMVLHFREGELGIDVNTPGNTTLDLLLTVELNDGSAFGGKDEVRITPNNPDKSRGKGGKGPK